jgi:hypothetical protein
VPHIDENLRLIECYPVFDPIRQLVNYHFDIFRKPIRAVLIQPATTTIEFIGVIPVKKGDIRGNASSQKFINQLIVKFKSLGI